jgi:hypothetical protein
METIMQQFANDSCQFLGGINANVDSNKKSNNLQTNNPNQIQSPYNDYNKIFKTRLHLTIFREILFPKQFYFIPVYLF